MFASRRKSNTIWIAAQVIIALFGVASAVAVPSYSMRLKWRQYFLTVGVCVCILMVVSISIDSEFEGLHGSAAIFSMMVPAAVGFAGVLILCKYRTDVLAHPSKELFVGPTAATAKIAEQWSNINNVAPTAAWCTPLTIRSSVRVVVLATGLNIFVSCFYMCYRLYVFPVNFLICLFPMGLFIFSATRTACVRGENAAQSLIIARHTLILIWLAGFMVLATGLSRLDEVFSGVKGGCIDNAQKCGVWAKNGCCDESSRFHAYMVDECPATCGMCDRWQVVLLWRSENDIVWILIAVLLGPAWHFSWSFHRGTRQQFLVEWGLDAGLLDEVMVQDTPVHEIPLRLHELAEQHISPKLQNCDAQELEMAIAESHAIAESLVLARNEDEEMEVDHCFGAASGTIEGAIIGVAEQREAEGPCCIQDSEPESSANLGTSELDTRHRTRRPAAEGGLQL